MATSSKAQVTLKLLIDTKAGRVLFAEAGKDFVDFLLTLPHLSVGTVVNLLTGQTMVGSLGNLFKSLQNMSETYFQSSQTKASVLKPIKAPLTTTQVPLLLLEGGTSFPRYYTCRNNHGLYYHDDLYNDDYILHPYFSDNANAVCPACKESMSNKMHYVAATNEVAKVGRGGFVKGDLTYMVRDDLLVTPMFSSSWIEMLNKLYVTEAYALVEKVVDFGRPEGLKLLKASLHSNKVLTDVFLVD